MADDSQHPPSFSPGRKWGYGFGSLVGVLSVLAIVVMVNFISHNFFFDRVFVTSRNRLQLSPRSLALAKSITNDVKVILYFDKDKYDDLYGTIAPLLNEYHLANPKIDVTTVDYVSSPPAAMAIKAKYQSYFTGPNEKNLVIFDCEGRVKIMPAEGLMEYTPERVPNERELELRKRPVAFKGEMMCSAMLLGVTNPKPLHACYLTGHGEHSLSSDEEQMGYLKFAGTVQMNYVQVHPITLLGTNTIPADTSFLIIAAPQSELPVAELEKIDHYLDEGGRLLVLFDIFSASKNTGLERTLEKWGVAVRHEVVGDADNTTTGQDVYVRSFATHPVVNALLGSAIQMMFPRVIARIESGTTAADAPNVVELAFSGPHSTLVGETNVAAKPYPVAVAVERGAVKGVANERGTTRIVVVGDSILFGNQLIDAVDNREFLGYTLNWLIDRPQLLEGLGPRQVSEFRILMTRTQLKSAYGILLAGLPGAVLLVGFLVWLRRRS